MPWAGYDDGAAMLDTVEVYGPSGPTAAWQQVASMPRRLCGHAAAAMGGNKIYVTGGKSSKA